jgi:hypothetical protein
MYKIPRRQVYCDTFGTWLKQMVWIFLVIKLFPHCVDIGSDALKKRYLEEPGMFFEQYENSIRRACGLPEVRLPG